MDTSRYIEVLEKGDAPSAIVPLIVRDAKEEDRAWRQAAEIVLERIKVQGEPALEFLDRVVKMNQTISVASGVTATPAL